MRLLFEIAVVLISAALTACAQPAVASPVGPSGHWETVLQLEGQEIKLEFDLGKNSKGESIGTFGQPVQGVKGLPLSQISLEGRTVAFLIKGNGQPSTFDGQLAADGKSIAGKFTMAGESMAATLMRTGNERFAAVPVSPAIGKELEGVWNGTLEVGGRQMRLIVKMANQPDGTAAGTVVSVDGTGVEIPIAMKQQSTQQSTKLTIDVPSVGASYAGVLNADATELTGEWKQQSLALPLKLRRAK